MPVTLRSPLSTPERILVFGSEGVGKSAKLLDVARRCPDATFHVIDNDYSQSCLRLLETSYSDLGNVVPYRCDPDDWEQMIARVVELKDVVGVNDWMAVDSMTPTWSAVQGWFIEKVHGVGVENYFLDVRIRKEAQREAARSSNDRESKSLGVLEGWMDWPVINKEYFRKLYNGILNIQGHVWLTAEGATLSKEDDDDVKARFQGLGQKPSGQKRLGFVPSTVLVLKKGRVGAYTMTTVKDRGREEVEDREVGDFAVDYMKKIAGWVPKVVGG